MVQRTLDLVCNSRNNWYWSRDSSRSKVDCLGSRKNQSSSCVKSSGASDLITPVPPLSFCPSVKSYSRPTQNSKIIDSFSPKKKIVEAKEDGKIVPIYIEVKTTSSPVDVEFFVSANELEKSKELNNSYFVYRIYDVNSTEPQMYRAQGEITKNFILDPVTYKARYKYPTYEVESPAID